MTYLFELFGALFVSAWLIIPFGLYVLSSAGAALIYDDSERDSGMGPLLTALLVFVVAAWAISGWRGIPLPAPSISQLVFLAIAYLVVGSVVAGGRWYAYCRKAVDWYQAHGGGSTTLPPYFVVEVKDGVLVPTIHAKYKVAGWLLYWPFYSISFILNDAARIIWELVAKHVNGLIAVIARLASHGING